MNFQISSYWLGTAYAKDFDALVNHRFEEVSSPVLYCWILEAYGDRRSHLLRSVLESRLDIKLSQEVADASSEVVE